MNVGAGQSILDALIDAGIQTPHSCRTGACRTCAVKVLAGEPEHRDRVLTPEERKQWMCLCVSRAVSERLVLEV